MDTVRWNIIGRGCAGWHAAAHNVSSSGGTFQTYVREAADGAYVYDAEGADRAAFVTWVVRGPMADPGLPPGGCDRFVPGASGEYRSLDSVAPDVWFDLLRHRVPGVRFGIVRDGTVVWED